MKHTLPVTITFLLIFIAAQIIGLILIGQSIQSITTEDGETTIQYTDTTVGERPETTGTETLIFIIIGVTIGTTILLLFVKHAKVNWWRTWFLIAAIITMSISFGVITQNALLAWLLAIILGAWKMYKPNPIIHNATEILMYAGIAILLVPILSITAMIILLVLVAIYDAYAVWKSKHMVKMAEFTSKANLFPGIRIGYTDKAIKPSKKTAPRKGTPKTGVLGGGDIAFPLLFSGTVMTTMIQQGFLPATAFYYALIITLTAAISLFILFYIAKKDKFYPAMPFITTGCIAGYIIILLL